MIIIIVPAGVYTPPGGTKKSALKGIFLMYTLIIVGLEKHETVTYTVCDCWFLFGGAVSAGYFLCVHS